MSGAAVRRRELVVSAERRCRLLSGPGATALLSEAVPPATERAFLIADERVANLHGPDVVAELERLRLAVEVATFPPGEASKTRATLALLQDRLLASRPDRASLVVALGGGVTTDLAGFVAATALRGLPLVNLPTTLLGAIDAAVGGKCGVNSALGKNVLGAFHWPVAVVTDTDFLRTLPPAEVRCGLAELVKHGVVASPDLLSELREDATRLNAGGLPDWNLVARAAEVKVRIVEGDPFELGLRRVLNFGHTVGHALEVALGYTLAHGHAVAMGMAVEARVASRLCGFPTAEAASLSRLIEALGLPTAPACEFDRARPHFIADKKALAGKIRMALPVAPGTMADGAGSWAVPVPVDLVRACWDG